MASAASAVFVDLSVLFTEPQASDTYKSKWQGTMPEKPDTNGGSTEEGNEVSEGPSSATDGNGDNISSPIESAEEDEEKQTWTRREMEEAKPYPLPEVTEDDCEETQ